MKHEQFDVILSSSPFPTSHVIAAELKKRCGLPWVADFRDPWTQNHCYPYGALRKYFETKLELNTLSHADAMIAAAPAYAKKQQDFHKKHTFVIVNGFPPESLGGALVGLADRFTITYTGQIYIGKQDPEKLMGVIEKLISQGVIKPDTIEVRFYGTRQNWLDDLIAKYNLRGVVKQYGVVSRFESWQKQKESHVLLLLNWEDPKEKGVYPSKMFEYLAAGRPVLATGGNQGDDLEKILAETTAGFYAPTIKEIEASILSFYKEYYQSGTVSYSGDSREIQKYSYLEMAKNFAQVLDQVA